MINLLISEAIKDIRIWNHWNKRIFILLQLDPFFVVKFLIEEDLHLFYFCLPSLLML
jgi:hypothetical protein